MESPLHPPPLLKDMMGLLQILLLQKVYVSFFTSHTSREALIAIVLLSPACHIATRSPLVWDCGGWRVVLKVVLYEDDSLVTACDNLVMVASCVNCYLSLSNIISGGGRRFPFRRDSAAILRIGSRLRPPEF
ncbi:Uncharacterized protein TCM_033792 [Theobroma cacao]|uniref:Uncharacterized protein n=1 Tax=Theobroma cacao TaxID=3641 RepID=A0A061FBI0_THECC|nr:Uncharacterized protein TCM_033792 [Theobroma cacao]